MTSPDANACDLSVVIVSWNTRLLLHDCLTSVLNGGLGDLQAEVWVVDNASHDKSADGVRDHFPTVRVIANTENVGFARANNQALEKATGRYFLLLNSDTIVPPNVLARLVRVMDAWPDAAVASPLLINHDAGGTPQFCWARFPNAKSEWSGKLDLGQSPYPLTDYADHDATPRMACFVVDWVGGACFCVRAEAARSVGLLDDGFFMYGEETEWCSRFQKAGWKTLMVPSLEVTHLGGASSRAVPVETRRRMLRSALRLFHLLYGPAGSLTPSVFAFARYAAYRIKHSFVRPKKQAAP